MYSSINQHQTACSRDPREEILLETNFQDDGVTITRSYNSNPYNTHRKVHRSDLSIDRYTERNGGAGNKSTFSVLFSIFRHSI